jgi:hypothetical protein
VYGEKYLKRGKRKKRKMRRKNREKTNYKGESEVKRVK